MSLICNDRNAFFTSEKHKKYHAWSCQNVCNAPTFLLDKIFIRFGTKLYRQVVGFSMGTNCAPLVADLFLFCYERDFMMSLTDDKQTDIIDAFNTTPRYWDDILNINNVYSDSMVSRIYHSELQLNKAQARRKQLQIGGGGGGGGGHTYFFLQIGGGGAHTFF